MPRAKPIWDIFARETGRDPFALSAEEMQVNVVAQPLVCAFQLAVWAAIGERLPPVRALAGYSVGELAAYGCAGALSPQDVIALARRRATLMDEAFPGGGAMLALRGLDRATVGALMRPAWRRNRHRQRRRPARGRRRAGRHRRLRRGSAGARRESHAAGDPHSVPHQPDAAGGRAVPPRAGKRGLETAFGAGAGRNHRRAHFRARAGAGCLAAQLAQTIDWAACLDGLRERGCSVLLELGPGAGLARMARDRAPEIPARSVAEFNSLERRPRLGWARTRLILRNMARPFSISALTGARIRSALRLTFRRPPIASSWAIWPLLMLWTALQLRGSMCSR